LYGLLATDKNYKILPERYTKEPYGIALKKGEQSESLRLVINDVLEHMEKSGEMRQIKQKWVR